MACTLMNIFLLFCYLMGLIESKSIIFNRNEEHGFLNSQDSSSNFKLNWMIQTCITDAEEVLMGLAQTILVMNNEPVDDDQLFHLLNCQGMGLFIDKLQGYHQQLLEFPLTVLDNNNLQMNKWLRQTEKNIRKHLSKLQSNCAPSWNLQDIMDTFLNCLLKTGYSVGRGSENSYVEDSLIEKQRIKSLLLALASRSDIDKQREEPPVASSSQNQYEHVGDIHLELESHIREVPPTFLSVALGSRLIQSDWERFNTSSPLLRTLASALAPAILRMGGTSANYLTYDPRATTKKHFHSCQDTDGLQLEDLDPFNLEDMYDTNIDGNPFKLESTQETKQLPSEGNLLAHETKFNDYYYDNRHLNDDWFLWPEQAYFDNFASDLEINTPKFDDFDSFKLSNDPIDTLRDALLNSNRHQENLNLRNMDEHNNDAQSIKKVPTKKLNGISDLDNAFDINHNNVINGISSDHENSIASNIFPFQTLNKHKENVHTVDRESNGNMNDKFSFGHLVFDNIHDSDNLQNKKIEFQNQNRRYWGQDQPSEERIPGYQLRRFRRNDNYLHQYPFTDYLPRSLYSVQDFIPTINDHNVDNSQSGSLKIFDPDTPTVLKSENALFSSPSLEAGNFIENIQNINGHQIMNTESNSIQHYYDLGVKHLYNDKQPDNLGSQNDHDWVYHHGMIHNHDLREHLENIDSNNEILDNESEDNQHKDQHIQMPFYDDKGCSCEYFRTTFTNFTMTGDDLSDLLEFVEAVNMTLLWDMNHLYREVDGGWDPTNARMIIQEVSRRQQTVIWQLGNEPNSYAHHTEFSITGRQEALDYGVFRRELLSVFPEVIIVGPDTTRPRFHGNHISDAFGLRTDSVAFMREFLTYGSQNIDVVSWHQYYMDGRTASVDDFMDPNLMDVLIKQLHIMIAVRDELAPNKPMWLTETSSAYGGGAPDLSNRYVAGFLWLDKLGLSAHKGVDLVARQTLYHGCYALLDPYLQPYPDYWLSVIYKQQVGDRVLELHLSSSTPTVRLYAHCLNPKSQHYKEGGVIVYGMNLGDKGASVNLQGRLNETHVLEMLLQPPEGDLQSSSVMLNGVVVELTSQMDLPSLNAHPTNVLGALHIPPQSMGFWLLPGAKAQACH